VCPESFPRRLRSDLSTYSGRVRRSAGAVPAVTGAGSVVRENPHNGQEADSDDNDNRDKWRA